MSHWMLDDVNVGSENPFSVMMDSDHILNAVFVEEPLMEPVVESCSSVGDQKDMFDLGEDMYVSGGAFPSASTFEVYVVVDVETWSDGITIPLRVTGTMETLSSDGDGNIFPTIVWSDLETEGEYDIVVDVNDNGQYDVGIDALDDEDIEVSAGVQVVPEFDSWITLTSLVMTTLTIIFLRKRRG